MAQPTPPAHAFADPNALRSDFALAMSNMYKKEVPLYGDLVKIVQEVNAATLASNNALQLQLQLQASTDRLTLERHGAIRLGTPSELQTVRRIFAILGMHPVGYYDLSIAGLPMHATCFRPLETSSLAINPFRVFTTLLRPELLPPEAREQATSLLSRRKIFTNKLLNILDTAESQENKLTTQQAEIFIPEALRSFSWQATASATFEQYQLLKNAHPILADIASFNSAHINHLTPRTLDITATHKAMREAGMAVKARIEGPPPRKCPILLRQTSFLALEETINFVDGDAASVVKGTHKARFGEIEERGAAVTPKGRELYDRLLEESMTVARSRDGLGDQDPAQMDGIVARVFEKYPDDWTQLRQEGLIYCTFQATGKQGFHAALQNRDDDISLLELAIGQGIVEATPITYEDFLPFSAAGIFQSNLQSNGALEFKRAEDDPKGFEDALQTKPVDLDEWYSGVQRRSLESVAEELGLKIDELV